MIRHRSALAAIVLAWVSTCAFGQELTTDAERDWKAVRSSDDPRTKLMAERWYNAIRQQEWSNTNGKFKVSAKYLAHDPNLEWVKLRVIRGTGKDRVVKDVQIPLDKLSKACQARVRTISVLAEKIAAAKEEEAKKESEEEENSDAPGRRGGESLDQEAMPDESRGGREGRDGFDPGLSGMDPREVVAESTEPPVVTNDGPPLPAALPPLPSRSEVGEMAAAPRGHTPPDTGAATPLAGGATAFQHPTSAEELKAIFEKAFAAGDKETLEQLFYWNGVPTERRQQTFTSLIDYAGAQLLVCELHEFTDGDSLRDFTIESATYFELEYETESVGHQMRWPYGEVEGKYYLGAWNPIERR